MATQAFDPRHLDVAAFAAARGRLSGEWPLSSLSRLHAAAPRAGACAVDWSAQGVCRNPGGEAQPWLELNATGALRLQCQRCLEDVVETVTVQRRFRFVPSEAEAERLDEQCEDEVLALPQVLDLQTLVEDEMILALPLIPKHETCPQPLSAGAAGPEFEAAAEALEDNPFAALKGWRARANGQREDH
ncbi:MAG: YceD family protein [Rubrivivax sp.]